MFQAFTAGVVRQWRWARDDAIYRDGVIALPDPVRYTLDVEDGVLTQVLLRLQTPDDAVQFATAYGLLTHGRTLEPASEPFSDFQAIARQFSDVVSAHIGLRELEEAVSSGGDGADVRERWQRVLGQKIPDDVLLARYLRGFISETVSIGIEGVEQWLMPTDQISGFTFIANPETLHGRAYYDLAMLLNAKRNFRYCDDCQRPYVVGDPRQRYCTTTCSDRARNRRWQERKSRSAPATAALSRDAVDSAESGA